MRTAAAWTTSVDTHVEAVTPYQAPLNYDWHAGVTNAHLCTNTSVALLQSPLARRKAQNLNFGEGPSKRQRNLNLL